MHRRKIATLESTKEVVQRFIQGDLEASIRKVSLEDFRRLAESMEQETVVLRAEHVVKVLRGYLQGTADIPKLADWTTVIFYGVHPAMIGHSELRIGHNTTIARKGFQDPDGITRIHVRYEEKCGDVIADVVSEMEELGDIRRELAPKEVQGWIGALLACREESEGSSPGDPDHSQRTKAG